jgi:hypothetical protein
MKHHLLIKQERKAENIAHRAHCYPYFAYLETVNPAAPQDKVKSQFDRRTCDRLPSAYLNQSINYTEIQRRRKHKEPTRQNTRARRELLPKDH